MTKIDIISGFLGAGKTTFIKKMLKEAFSGEQVVLIENEFGEIGIDGGFLKEAGIEIREMNSGCICCSLVGDFGKSLKEVVDTYHPDRILIEPSGVGKLSDVIKAVQDVQDEIEAELNSFTTVVDVTKCRLYKKNFGEFFSNQIEYAGAIILSRTDKAKPEKVEESVELLRELNEKAPIITTPIEQLLFTHTTSGVPPRFETSVTIPSRSGGIIPPASFTKVLIASEAPFLTLVPSFKFTPLILDCAVNSTKSIWSAAPSSIAQPKFLPSSTVDFPSGVASIKEHITQ